MREMSRSQGQSGFSLLELIVAMAVTLVITGAVYGLMAGGNSAFRREPELTDRQQNARVAMDMIQRDISNAGVNMGPFFQSFTRNLNGAGRITGPGGQVADHLEVFGNDGTCPDAPTIEDKGPGFPGPTSGGNINFRSGVPNCYNENAMVLVVYGNGMARWGLAFNVHGGSNGNGDTNFPPGQNTAAGSQITSIQDLKSYNGAPPVAMSPLQMVRYEIAMDPPGSTVATGGAPALWRSPTGGRDIADGVYKPPTTVANVALGAWQVLARGVEDLQVRYRNGGDNWTDDPGVVGCAGTCATPTKAEYDSAVREVRVTMTVRAAGHNLQGQNAGAGAGVGSRANAVRGNVTTVTSVKALQTYLAEAPRTAACPECPVWR